MPPALFPALAVLAGAVAGTFIDATFRIALPALSIVCAVAVGAWWRRTASAALSLTCIGFCLAAAILAADARETALYPSLRAILDARVGGFLIDRVGPENNHDPIRVRAELIEDAAIREDYVSLRADVMTVEFDGHRHHATGGVVFTVSGEAAARRAGEWRAGRVIEARATFRRAARYLNEGVPDFERQLALDGTTLFGSVKSGLLVEVVAGGSRFEECAATVRARVRSAITRWVPPRGGTPPGIVTAVLIGDRTGLPDEVTDRLQRAGTYHVIAISGGNIAVLAGLILGLLGLIGLHGRARALVTIVALILYAQVTTAGPSVWRATLMAVVYLTARLIDQRTPPWQATALAAGVMALVAPLDVRSAGFILTFGATGALLESARWIRTVSIRLKPDPTAPAVSGFGRTVTTCVGSRFGWIAIPLAWLAVSVVASVAVELALVPVSATSFSRVTLAGPLLNLVAVPLMAVAQVAGLVVVAFDQWPAIASPAGWLASVSASAIVGSAQLVDLAPGLAWRVPPPGIPLLAAYYVSLLVMLFAAGTRIRILAAPVCVAALMGIIGVAVRTGPPPVGGVRLTMFDVGQGEALLLESGSAQLQVDTGGAPFGGGSFDIGARVVAPALWARGVHQLDAMLLTHGDPDHIGGAPLLLEAFRPRRLWEGIVVPRHQPSRELRERAVSAGIGVDLRRADESFPWGQTRIRVLHPPEPDWERPRVRNDDSVVLEVTCGDVALLLTGDISGDVERAITPRLTPARTRILKVGHHGSRTSSSSLLLERWRPQIALISAGRGNTFGHPAPEVIERLESIGARIYRTDRDGEVTLESDCKSVVVSTFNGGKD